MKNSEATIFMFIASVIIGILISLNINFKREPGKYFLSAQQYQDAITTKNRLLNDISGLRDQTNELDQKIRNYIYGDKSDDAKYQQIKSELAKNQLIVGTSEVEGPGIEILLNDFGSGKSMSEVIHSYEIDNILSDLKAAGAEAISINDQRIINSTWIECSGDYLLINDVQVPAPFYIYAIGNKDVLQSYMASPDSWVIELRRPERRIHCEINQSDSLKIPAYNSKLKSSHLKEK